MTSSQIRSRARANGSPTSRQVKRLPNTGRAPWKSQSCGTNENENRTPSVPQTFCPGVPVSLNWGGVSTAARNASAPGGNGCDGNQACSIG